MKNKIVVTEDNYKELVLRRMILLCWILLGICFIIKIFGGNFFSIICTNKTFIRICNYIDNSFWFYILNYINYILTTSLLILASCGQYKFNKIQMVIIAITYNLCFLLKFVSLTVSSICEQIILFIMVPLSFNRNILRTILAFVLVNAFQILSLITKNLGFRIMSDSFMVGIIFLIDYYIMLILYYLYSNLLKEKNKMGWFGAGWLKDDIEKLKALRDMTKDEEEKKTLDEVIEHLEKKAK